MIRLLQKEDGYALVLALIFMPLFLGFSLLVVDMGRGNNSHADLQAAADALALDGARELDGGTDSITRAKTAMAKLSNSVTFLGVSGAAVNIPLVYADSADNEFNVIFLKDIPSSDDDPIDQDWVNAQSTNAGEDAKYIYVFAQSENLDIFFNIFTDSVPVAAQAVATYTAAACDVTPLFICNPFETALSTGDLHGNFASGGLYGRQLRLSLDGSATAGPGNFGFLKVNEQPGASALRDALATGNPGGCFEEKGVDTKTGANIGPADQGLGVRMGIFSGPMGSFRSNPRYRPAQNVRKGSATGNACPSPSGFEEADYVYEAMAFPMGDGTEVLLPGGGISQDSSWDIDLYFDVNHTNYAPDPHPMGELPDPSTYPPPVLDISITTSLKSTYSSYPGGLGTPVSKTPSRYDVYRYELNEIGMNANPAPNGETGQATCEQGYNLEDYATALDRRVIFAAVINCLDHSDLLIGGSGDNIPVEAFASMFITKPFVTVGSTKYIPLEIKDITGAGGNGTLENFLREEAVLVR